MCNEGVFVNEMDRVFVWTPGRGRNTPPPPWVPRSRAEMGATSALRRGRTAWPWAVGVRRVCALCFTGKVFISTPEDTIRNR